MGFGPTTLLAVTYATSDAQRQLLDILAEATDELGYALACLAEAYDALDEQNGDRLEKRVFRPVQVAYGFAKRAHAEFAARHDLPGRAFEQPSAGVSTRRAAGFVDSAVDAVAEADLVLATLQDSMLPVEAGDEGLRAGLTAIRDRVRGVPEQARELLRTLGR
jgi:hypothetical protein